jgi:hypothetical protein
MPREYGPSRRCYYLCAYEKRARARHFAIRVDPVPAAHRQE